MVSYFPSHPINTYTYEITNALRVCIDNNKVNTKNSASTQKKFHNFCHNFPSEIVSVHI